MNIKDTFLQLCKNMSVVIYGAGKRGIHTIEILNRFHIPIKQVADSNVGKEIEGFITVPIEKMISEKLASVCIVTPQNDVNEVKQILQEHFIVLDYEFLYRISYFFPEDLEFRRYCVPFCHYESPYPFQDEIKKKIDRTLENDSIRDVDLDMDNQISFLQSILQYADEFKEIYTKVDMRYKIQNNVFSGLDAFSLFAVLKIFKPKRIIEIGSGYSTRLMLDYNELYADNKMHIDSIEPDPVRVKNYIKQGDNITFLEKPVQDISIDFFSSLHKNDLLFIDSSHVARRNGDVPYEFFKILPRLERGVLIHFHDIHWPFEYCDEWINDGRAFNEIYILHAFLMNNSSYRVLLFNSMMEEICKSNLETIKVITEKTDAPNGSIYLIKD